MALIMSRWIVGIVYTACFLFLPRLTSCDCYYPNGNLSTAGDQPCSSGGSDGPCCPLNWECLSNGLCYLENEDYLGRYTCTDKTWEAEGCPNICTHGNTASGDEAVLECSPGNYCCDANRPDAAGGQGCCDTSHDFFTLPDGGPIASIGISIGISTAALSTQSSAAESSSDTFTTSTTTTSSAASSTSSAASSTSSAASSTPSAASSTPSAASSTPSVPSATPSVPSATPSVPSSTSPASSAAGKNGGTSSSLPPGTSVVLVTSVVVNSAGSSSGIVTSTLVSPQSSLNTSSYASTKGTSSNNLGTKIGLGVGIPIGIIAFSGLAFVLWRHQKNKKRTRASAEVLAQPIDPKQMDYMYKNNTDLGTPYTATTASPEVDQRASGKYSSMNGGAGDVEHRGISTDGLGLHPISPELPDSPRPSELSGNAPFHRDLRNSQMSELAGSRYQPSELPDRPFP